MKRFAFFCFFALCLISSALATAQSRNYPNSRDNMLGVPEDQSTKKQKKPDYVEEGLKRLDEALMLDSFQQAVIRQQLEKTKAKEDEVIAEEIPAESKTEKIIMLRNKMDEEILKILTPEQQQKFADFKEKLKKKKK